MLALAAAACRRTRTVRKSRLQICRICKLSRVYVSLCVFLVRIGASVEYTVEAHAAKDGTVVHTSHVWSSAIGCYDAKAELERIGERCHTLCTARILAYHHRLWPILDMSLDPFGQEWFRHKIVHWALEEALRLGCVEVDCYDVVYASDVHEIRDHSGCDGSPVALALGLSGIRKVGHDGLNKEWSAQVKQDGWTSFITSDGSCRAAFAGRDHDEKLDDIVVDPALSVPISAAKWV